MKKVFAVLVVAFVFCAFSIPLLNTVYAEKIISPSANYVVYNEDGTFLFERSEVTVGDEYIDKELNEYRVYSIDEENKIGKAYFVKSYKKPSLKNDTTKNANIGADGRAMSSETISPFFNIGMYLTHNDESYISGDGVSSIYGAGGIHDVARALKQAIISNNINVELDETLHIPHDTSAYTRSGVTARSLYADCVDALFDIHRDATSRSFYVTNVDGEDRCKIRIVVGKANANYADNKNFAIYLFAVADELGYDWLFNDIYMASGHYNQGITEHALLFEMGSHLVEKSLVISSIEPLAEVIVQALYSEYQNQEPETEEPEPTDPTTGETENNTDVDPDTNQELDTNVDENDGSTLTNDQTINSYEGGNISVWVIIAFLLIMGGLIFYLCKNQKK